MNNHIQIADPRTAPKLAHDAQAVTVIHLNQKIGSGKLTSTESGLAVHGSYQWPPDAPAEVRFSFVFTPLSENTCTVEVNWPGLLSRRIPEEKASYFMLLLMARPEYVISTSSGDNVTATFMGPMGHPEITTALQVNATISDASSSASLVFRFEKHA